MSPWALLMKWASRLRSGQMPCFGAGARDRCAQACPQANHKASPTRLTMRPSGWNI